MNDIEKSDLFKGLSVQQYNEIMAGGVLKTLPPKSFLFHQGDTATMCFLVLQGRLKISMLNEQGKEAIVRYINPGEIAAAAAILKDGEYPATAEAVEKTEIIGWNKQRLLHMMETYPSFAINILYYILERLDEMQRRYLELSTEQVEQRVARALLRLMKRSGLKTSEGIRIQIPLNRQTIADYTGTTMFTVSRILSSWEKKGLIRSGRENVVIKDPHTLVKFSETGRT